MNKVILMFFAVLTACILSGRDYTEKDIRELLSGVKEVRLRYPPQIPDIRPDSDPVAACGKCGKKYRLLFSPGIDLLVRYLNEKGGDRAQYELDKTKICPHCGDGRIYLKSQREFYSFRRGHEWKTSRTQTMPVCEEELLILCAAQGEWDLPFFLQRFAFEPSFFVQTEAEYKAMQKKSLHKNEVRTKDVRRAEIFQDLTDNASILRRDNPDDFHKPLHLPGRRRQKWNSQTILALGMIWTLDYDFVWHYMTCPGCKKVFYVLDGTNRPIMAPLGDLQAIQKKLDIDPDYSSLCPYCHKDAAQRLLHVTIHLDDKEFMSDVSPADLALLFFLMQGHKNFTHCQLQRLRAILQGKKDDLHLAAEVVSP